MSIGVWGILSEYAERWILAALHYACAIDPYTCSPCSHIDHSAQHGSSTVLNHLLSHEDCDVDLVNRLEGATPLHVAIKLEDDPQTRIHIIETLLEAGADTSFVVSAWLDYHPLTCTLPE